MGFSAPPPRVPMTEDISKVQRWLDLIIAKKHQFTFNARITLVATN